MTVFNIFRQIKHVFILQECADHFAAQTLSCTLHEEVRSDVPAADGFLAALMYSETAFIFKGTGRRPLTESFPQGHNSLPRKFRPKRSGVERNVSCSQNACSVAPGLLGTSIGLTFLLETLAQRRD